MIGTSDFIPSDQRYISQMADTKNTPLPSSSNDPTDPKDVAEYSASILANVRDLAAASGLTFLAYLVQVAVEEAKIQANSDH
jgi:hypothetical protein